jgi:hypothetical protein
MPETLAHSQLVLGQAQYSLLYPKVWFNTPRQAMLARQAALAKLAPAQIKQRLQEISIKPKNPLARGRV